MIFNTVSPRISSVTPESVNAASTNATLLSCIWLATIHICFRPQPRSKQYVHKQYKPSDKLDDFLKLALLTMAESSEKRKPIGITDFAKILHAKSDQAKSYEMTRKLAFRTLSAYISKKIRRVIQEEYAEEGITRKPDLYNSNVDVLLASPQFHDNSYQIRFPLSYSILLNFGFDGKSHILFSDTHWGDNDYFEYYPECKSTEIYDPTNNVCRPVICEPGHQFVHDSCEEIVGNAPSKVEKESPENLFQEDIMNMVVLKANVTFSDYLIALTADFKEMMIESLSKLLNTSTNRIQNFTVHKSETPTNPANLIIQRLPTKRYSMYIDRDIFSEEYSSTSTRDTDKEEKFTMEISFILMPLNTTKERGKSVSSIIEEMDSLVQSKSFMINVKETRVTVVGLKNDSDTIMPNMWCMNGIKSYYTDTQFTMVTLESRGKKSELIYINKTDRFYQKGEFDLTIFIQSTIGFNKANVSGFVFVCDKPRIRNKKCGRISLSKKEYTIFENKSVSFRQHILGIDDYQFDEGSSIVICIPSTMKVRRSIVKGCDIGNEELIFSQIILTIVFGLLSLVALLAVLITYSLFSKLRNIPGINMMNLTLALFLADFIFLVSASVESDAACITVAVSLHYLFLASFFWMNVMSYDLFRTFGHVNILPTPRQKSKVIPRYILYAWGAPLLIVAACLAIEFSHISPSVTIGYGKANPAAIVRNKMMREPSNRSLNNSYRSMDTAHTSHHLGCWIQDPLASLIAFGIPLICIVLTNVVMFIRTIYCIRRNLKTINLRLNHPVSGRHDVILYVKMSVVMGFTWVLGFASSGISSGAQPTESICLLLNIIGILFVIFNCSQGIFICSVFVLNKRVFGLYQSLWAKLMKTIKQRENSIFTIIQNDK
ncbi:uncharacterized protein LOC106881692 [Octopus bimaculoides]|uniref:G-protein coupled receptors family 2 profile 2 domain-containing protein n=1 Tax=Octopus bimaculoides TaxID=37653 RepID=A0A0L8IH43_OCTBM|nr:uncharacterized protein LOC106881692 [Octopus bimaculoides]|eukprot:XP_014787680.1 PREDICTED: uncharacterized protein LOC106881692 [Octopus bimaculoides]